jgi:hypothetical protein
MKTIFVEDEALDASIRFLKPNESNVPLFGLGMYSSCESKTSEVDWSETKSRCAWREKWYRLNCIPCKINSQMISVPNILLEIKKSFPTDRTTFTDVNLFKKLILPTTGLIVALLAYQACLFIASTLFFDELFYRKSEKYGYHDASYELHKKDISRQLETRIEDLLSLLNNEKAKVLGADTEIEEKRKEYTVALIGDSTFYGTGVTVSNTVGEVLEGKLDKVFPSKVHTLALPGDSIVDNYAKFQLATKNISPDIYIVGMVDNDLLFDSYTKYPNSEETFDTLRAECAGAEFVYRWPDPTATTEKITVDAYFPSIFGDYSNKCFFSSVIKKMVAQNTLFFFTKYPVDPQQVSNEGWRKNAEVMNEMLRVVREYGGTAIYPPENFRFERVSEKEGHPSAATHEKFAETMYQAILAKNGHESN